MLLSNARNNSQGFTLIETLIIVIIIGILSAIAGPSFLAIFNRNKVNNALDQVRGALQEAQREAIRKSKSCTVYIPDGTTQAQLISDCFVTSDSTSTGLTNIPNGLPSKKIEQVAIKSNLPTTATTAQQIQFSFRGNTTNSGTIVLYMSNGSTQQKECLAISSGLGIMRTGNYSGSTSSAADITAGTCTTSL